ncbi:Tigger transposable element-derived protein 4 [Araneus ventricosus]|uniref:Tigger transposable element-derived protein 4 n=1 Tax=Araneus ventricosus TaxID=182803 RepID=A0A4Y2BXV0_ARAVE|nr:Tigger transposable element-derived protein 4 [Araneus ventricosus]
MIEYSKKPRCFAKVKSFPLKYKANRKVWMTSEIFGDWLKSLDKSMRVKKRKIILIIDNCGAHNNLPALKNVSVKFFPENTISKLQPMDQGIIRSFKVNYRRQLVRKLVDAIDEGSTLPKINNGCEEEKETNEGESKSIEKESEETVDAANEVLEINFTRVECHEICIVNISFEEFLDDPLATCGTLTDAEIIDNVRGISEDEEAEEHTDAPKVIAKEAEKAVELLTTFLESQEKVGHEGFAALANLRRLIETKKVKRQKSLKDYFYC